MNAQDSASRTSRVEELLRQTAEAHFGYEQEALGGVRDEQWPIWYAPYMRNNGLPELLGGLPAAPEVSGNLENLLANADERYRAASPAEEWPAYYAAFLVRL